MNNQSWNVHVQFQDGHRAHRFATPQAAYAFARKYVKDPSIMATVIRPDGSEVSVTHPKTPGTTPSPGTLR